MRRGVAVPVVCLWQWFACGLHAELLRVHDRLKKTLPVNPAVTSSFYRKLIYCVYISINQSIKFYLYT